MLGWIREKMTNQESAPRGGRFSASGLTIAKNGASTCNDLCAPNEDYSTVVGNDTLTCNDLCTPNKDYSTVVGNGS